MGDMIFRRETRQILNLQGEPVNEGEDTVPWDSCNVRRAQQLRHRNVRRGSGLKDVGIFLVQDYFRARSCGAVEGRRQWDGGGIPLADPRGVSLQEEIESTEKKDIGTQESSSVNRLKNT